MKTENKIKITLVNWFDSHWYRIEQENQADQWFPSVNTKLGIIDKPFLSRWRGDIGNREADLQVWESARKGSRIHLAWYLLYNQGTIIYNPIENPQYNEQQIEDLKKKGEVMIIQNQMEMWDVYKLQQWHEIVNPKMKDNERMVYSLKNKDAGTLDKVFEIEGGEYEINGSKPLRLEKGLYVTDLKTGKSVSNESQMQTAAYANCFTEMTGLKINGSLIIHTGSKVKSGIPGLSTHLRNYEQVQEDYENYRAAANLWDRFHKDDQPKIRTFPSLIKLQTNG